MVRFLMLDVFVSNLTLHVNKSPQAESKWIVYRRESSFFLWGRNEKQIFSIFSKI